MLCWSFSRSSFFSPFFCGCDDGLLILGRIFFYDDDSSDDDDDRQTLCNKLRAFFLVGWFFDACDVNSCERRYVSVFAYLALAKRVFFSRFFYDEGWEIEGLFLQRKISQNKINFFSRFFHPRRKSQTTAEINFDTTIDRKGAITVARSEAISNGIHKERARN